MIPRIKGLRISNAREREHITGSEYIPFQDEDVNGKIKLSNLKDVSIYVFNPEVTDDWLNHMVITQEEYDALYDAIKNHKLIIVSPRVPAAGDWNVAHGQVMLNSNPCLYIPKFVRQEIDGTLARIEYYQLYFYNTRRLRITKYNTPSFLQNGNGKSILTDNGQYINIGDLALTNVVFEDGTNSCIYDLNSNRIVFGAKDTECVKFNTSKSDNTLNMKLLLAKATATMDGIMSKEDKVKLDTTLTEQITALLNAIAKEIQDRTNADNVLQGKINQEVVNRTIDVNAVRSTVNSLPTSIVSGELALLTGYNDKVPLVGRTYNKQSGNVYIENNHFDTFGYAPMANTGQAGMITGDFKVALDNALVDLAKIQGQIGGLGYTHPAGTAANKSQGLYKFATDATSHISSVLAVVQKDITDLGIPSNTNLTDAINNAKNEVLTTVNLQIVNLGTNLSPIIDSLVSQLSVLTNRVASLETQFSRLLDNFTEHVDNKNNPHQVTKAQIGLGNVNNTSDMQKPISTLQAAAISNARAEAIATAETALNNHANRRDNPHVVTRAQLSLDTTNEVVFKKVTAINGFHKE